jgi:hypothetical protein
MKKMPLVFFIIFGFLFFARFSSAEHFVGLQGTPQWVDFIGVHFSISGEPASIGDEIGVFTETGILCGSFVVKKPGQYGVLHVYGDDPTTAEVEGAVPGGRLIFRVWDVNKGTEKRVLDKEMEPYSAGSLAEPPLPVIWTKERDKFGLNIRSTN